MGNIERQKSNFEIANIHHQHAVELLEKIAAKYDLAEAYLQWGMILQSTRRIAESSHCFARAIAIYQKILLPNKSRLLG